MLQDLLAAARSLRRHPAFTGLAVVTIALGIGATTAIVSVVEAVVLRPLPYPDPDRLVDISHLTKEGARLLGTWHDVVDLRLESEPFEDVAARAVQPFEQVVTAGAGSEPFEVTTLIVTYNYFSVLGVEPAMGRTFTVEDANFAAASDGERAQAPLPAVVISHGLWQRVLGGDPDVSRRPIHLFGGPVQVVGVLPPDFRLLHERRYRDVEGMEVDLFQPLAEGFLARGRPEGRQGRGVLLIGRLREGITYERAQASLDALAARYRAEVPFYGEGELRLPLHPIHDDLKEGTEEIVLVLAGGVLFLMLLVCANVANLMLVRGRMRAGEDAVRSALGGGALRLGSQRLVESAILGVVGGVLGISIGWGAIRAVEALGPRNLPLLDQVEMNAAVLAGALGATLASVVFFGLVSALQVVRRDPAAVLRMDSGRGRVGGQRTMLQLLVVSELALSMVLLSGALTMVRSMAALTSADLGYDAEGLLAFDIAPIGGVGLDPESRRLAIRELEARFERVPGVVSVGRTSMPPLSGRVFSRNFGWTEEVLQRLTERAEIVIVSPGYFRAMRTGLLAGRFFDASDIGAGSPSIIVDEAIARRAWPGEDPIGKYLHVESELGGTIVGVVQSMLLRDYRTENIASGAIHYVEAEPGQIGTFVLRGSGEAATVAGLVRETVRSYDPDIRAYRIQDLSARVRMARAPTRFVLLVMVSLAVIALVVAVGGLFGVISYGVRTRTAEFGLRLALGAEAQTIAGMVLRQALAVTLLGVLLGLGGTLLSARILASVAYEVSPTDPLLLAATSVILAAASVIACYAPARWAGARDPVRALAS